VAQSKEQIIQSINEVVSKHPLQSVALFGSIISNRFNENSDVDIVVRFQESLDPMIRGECMLNLQIELEDKLQRSVDILNQAYVFNPIMKSVINEAVLIYGR